MIKKNKPATEAELELLNLLSEEMAECIQVVSKISRFGFNSYHPNDVNKTQNRSRLTEELGDVMCVVNLLVERNIVNLEQLELAVESKKERLKKYSNVFYVDYKSEKTLQEELDYANQFINDAFTAHPNLDQDVKNIRYYG